MTENHMMHHYETPESTTEASPTKAIGLQQSEILELQPLTFETYTSSVSEMYKHHFPELAAGIALLSSPTYMIMALMTLVTLTGPANSPVLALLVLFSLPFSLIINYIIPGLMALMVSHHITHKKIDMWECLNTVYQRKYPIITSGIGAVIAHMLFMGGGAILFMIVFGILGALTAGLAFIPGAILAVAGFVCFTISTSLTPVVAVLEEKSWFDAVRRSIDLTWNSSKPFSNIFWFTAKAGFAIGLLAALLALPCLGIKEVLLASVGKGALVLGLSQLANIASGLLFNPAAMAIPVYLYYEQRRYTEGLTMEKINSKAPPVSMLAE